MLDAVGRRPKTVCPQSGACPARCCAGCAFRASCAWTVSARLARPLDLRAPWSDDLGRPWPNDFVASRADHCFTSWSDYRLTPRQHHHHDWRGCGRWRARRHHRWPRRSGSGGYRRQSHANYGRQDNPSHGR